MDWNASYKCMLTKQQYTDIIKNLDRSSGFFHRINDDDDRYTGIASDEAIYLVRFAEGEDEFAIPPKANPEETFYEINDIPAQHMRMPKPTREIHFETRQQLQEFLNNLSKYRKGELKIPDEE